MGICVPQLMLGCIKGSKWREASKCKSLIKRVKHRLMIQKKRRNSIVRQTRADIAQLFHNGMHHIALRRVEQLHKDECLLSAYCQVEDYCDCIYFNLGDISKHSKLSNEVNEAVSSLIFAASRCGELPELHSIRNLLKCYFGQEFERISVELLPGNNVNSQLKQNLCRNRLLNDAKLRLMNNIANEYTSTLGRQFDKQKLQLCHPSTENQDFIKKDELLDIQNNGRAQMCKFEDILRMIGSKFSSSSRTDVVTFHCDSYDGCSESAADFVNYKNRNLVLVEMENHDHSSYSTTSHDTYDEREIVAQFNQTEIEEDLRPRLSHVHPKLPDYDDLVTKFIDLKKEYMQKHSNNRALSKWMCW